MALSSIKYEATQRPKPPYRLHVLLLKNYSVHFKWGKTSPTLFNRSPDFPQNYESFIQAISFAIIFKNEKNVTYKTLIGRGWRGVATPCRASVAPVALPRTWGEALPRHAPPRRPLLSLIMHRVGSSNWLLQDNLLALSEELHANIQKLYQKEVLHFLYRQLQLLFLHDNDK